MVREVKKAAKVLGLRIPATDFCWVSIIIRSNEWHKFNNCTYQLKVFYTERRCNLGGALKDGIWQRGNTLPQRQSRVLWALSRVLGDVQP